MRHQNENETALLTVITFSLTVYQQSSTHGVVYYANTRSTP